MRDMNWDEVHIGDVGRVTQGYFRRLFNVTVPRSHILNGGRIPDNFVTLDFDSERDTEVEYTSPVITPQIPFFRDHMTCEKVSGQESDNDRFVECSSNILSCPDQPPERFATRSPSTRRGPRSFYLRPRI